MTIQTPTAPALRNRVTTGVSSAMLKVLRYHAPWGPASSFAAEDLSPAVLAAVQTAAVTQGLLVVSTDQEFGSHQVTQAGLDAIAAAERTTTDALTDGGYHQGQRVHAAGREQERELRRKGLIGKRGGLTRRGSIAAERAQNDELDRLFPL